MVILSRFVFEIVFNIVQWNRTEVIPFKASIEVPFIHLSIVCVNQMTMKMAMHIATIMSDKGFGVNGNMRKDKTTKHSAVTMMKISSANVVEILKIKFCGKPVMISCNKDFPSIEPLHQAQSSPGKSNISQTIHCIFLMHFCVPSLFQILLHFF